MDLPNCKIMVLTKAHRIALQKRVFALGGAWGDGKRTIGHLDRGYLFIEDGKLSYCETRRYFETENLEQLSYYDFMDRTENIR